MAMFNSYVELPESNVVKPSNHKPSANGRFRVLRFPHRGIQLAYNLRIIGHRTGLELAYIYIYMGYDWSKPTEGYLGDSGCI